MKHCFETINEEFNSPKEEINEDFSKWITDKGKKLREKGGKFLKNLLPHRLIKNAINWIERQTH
jgi:hypothetical protein